MKKLFISEKPYTAKAIVSHLWPDGSCEKGHHYWRKGDVTVTCAAGHILGLALPGAYGSEYAKWDQYGIYPDKWKVVPLAGKEELVKSIKALLKDTDVVIHAGDPDREGQLIVDEILDYCGYKGQVQRILFSSIDDESVKRAFDHIEDNKKFVNSYYAGLSRSRADWLVGMNLSRAYTVNAGKYGYEHTLRIGRVKTPTLALVVNREHEIKNFKPSKYYLLSGFFSKDRLDFKAAYKASDAVPQDSEGRIVDKAVLDAVKAKIKKVPVVVKAAEYKEGIENPPLPFSLDKLQVAAGQKFNLSPKQVLDTVQKLYENKYVSYPRSDCNYIPVSLHGDAAKVVPMLSGLNVKGAAKADVSLKSLAFNDKKISAHHAIIPTGVKPEGLTGAEKDIFEMISERYILQFYKPCTFKTVNFALQAADEIFTGSGKLITNPGFKDVLGKEAEAEEDEEAGNTVLPQLKVGDKVATIRLEMINKITKPPKRFTLSSIITAMTDIWRFMDKDNPNKEKLKEVKGIGTSATRGEIVDELMAKTIKGKPVEPCIKLVKKELVPTSFGLSMIEDIVDPVLTKADRTAEMEYALAEIEDGKRDMRDYMVDIQQMVNENITYAENKKFKFPDNIEQHICPVCKQKPLRKVFSKKTNKYYWICSDDGCVSPLTKKKVWYDDMDGAPVVFLCPDDGALLHQRKGKFGLFWVCEKCNRTFKDVDNKPDFSPKAAKPAK